jgi:hypothetical protein
MKAGNGHHFEQSYNAQAAVEVEGRLIVGEGRISLSCKLPGGSLKPGGFST